MKRNSLLRCFAILLCCGLFACQKQLQSTNNPVLVPPPVTQADMLVCHQTIAWDSTLIHDKLLGRWQWEYIQCYWNPEDGNKDDFRGMIVEFRADSTLTVLDSNGIAKSAIWQLINSNDGFWRLQTNPLIAQLPGHILFCTERVLFSDTYIDGCNNYFKKLN